jgi:hypothetical protein
MVTGNYNWGLTPAPLFDLFLPLALRVWNHMFYPKKEVLGSQVHAHVSVSMVLSEFIEGSGVPQADRLVVPLEKHFLRDVTQVLGLIEDFLIIIPLSADGVERINKTILYDIFYLLYELLKLLVSGHKLEVVCGQVPGLLVLP